MIPEIIELTLSHVDLGTLHESAFMELCGTAQCHSITAGKGISIRDIKDRQERPLYPGFYMTHLTVPPTRLLSEFRVWDRVAVNPDVKCYGGLILASSFSLLPAADHEAWIISRRRDGPLPPHGKYVTNPWDDHCPTLRGGTMFVVDGQYDPSTPAPGTLAELPVLDAPPASIERFTTVQRVGTLALNFPSRLEARTFHIPVLAERDAARGRSMMFATFVRMMERAEREFIQTLRPAFSVRLADCMETLERETYFLANCGAGDQLEICVRGALSAGPDLRDRHRVFRGELHFAVEMTESGTGNLLAVSRARKALVIPSQNKRTLQDADRMLSSHGGEAP